MGIPSFTKSHLKSLLTNSALALGTVGLMPVPTATAASFPCEKASTAVEKTICKDTELSTLDEHLGRYYAAARSVLGHAEVCLSNDQRSWLRTQRDACKDAPCLKATYLQRLAELEGLQPGVTSIRNIELPKAMPLVWIIPPALDEVAAPRNRKATPLTARGKLVDEVAGGDGFVLRTATGRKHLLVPLMFLESPTTETLAVLARTPNTSYEVRGQTEGGTRGSEAFTPSRCRFVYRASQ